MPKVKKFKPEFAPRLFLEQLTYYGNIKDFKIHFLKEEYKTEEIKEFLTQEATKL